nr:Chain A, Andersonin-Y1 (AY1) [Odorrana andersonii]
FLPKLFAKITKKNMAHIR